jgi:hypothetical protein
MVPGHKDEPQMSQQSAEEMLIRKYLLGDLDQRQQEQVEEQLFCDDGFTEKLSAVQDNLIDEYVFDLLPERERELFEKNLSLSDERRNKIQFARALELYIEDQIALQPALPAPRRRLLSWLTGSVSFLLERKARVAVALATILLIAILTPRVTRWLIPNTEVVPLETTRANIEQQITELNKRPLKSTVGDRAMPELALQPLRLREGSEMKRVVLNGDEELLRLKLTLPPERYENYRAITSLVGGGELFTVEDLRPEDGMNAGMIIINIPPKFLPTSDYQLELKGVSAGGQVMGATRYSFRVINNVTRR